MEETAQVEQEHLQKISELTGEDATPEADKPLQFVGNGFEALGNTVDEARGNLLGSPNTVGEEPASSWRQKIAQRAQRLVRKVA